MLKNFFSFAFLFLSVFLSAGAAWIVRKFGNVTTEQLLFHLYMPLDSDAKTIISFIRNVVFPALLSFIPAIYLIKNKKSKRYFFGFTLCLLACSCFYSAIKLNVPDWFNDNFSSRSQFYETYYVDPSTVSVRFPEHKKNLILIFAESWEATYSEKNGQNLIMQTTQFAAKNGINFSDSQTFGGAEQVAGTGFTTAGLIAHTCGIPLHLPIKPNYYRIYAHFLPKARCLFDILKDNGYESLFVIGTKATFAGMDIFLQSHGNIKINDYTHYTGKGGKLLDLSDLKWGLNDSEVYALAKKELKNLEKNQRPFFFTMMTMDTHFASHYFDKKICEQKYLRSDVYKNVISCADYQLSSFLSWLKEQDFYKNTAVVIVGDHLAMNDAVFGKDKRRRVFNLFVNTEKKPVKTTNRKFTTMDIYPTILEAMGATVSGGRLALGTSLFSEIPTVLEQIKNTDEFNKEIMKRSSVYDYLLYGKHIDL